MAAYIFQKISDEGRADGIKPGSVDARDWLRDRASEVGSVNAQNEMRNKARLQTNLNGDDIGKMFMFFYDPKGKKELPFYDRFPLIFPMEKYSDGFLGMNLHYLPPLYRARLMDALYSIVSGSQSESKKLRLSYGALNSASRYKYFRPTVKRYLLSQVRSRFLNIPADDWDIALMLPTERFSKSGKQKVWNDSKIKIRNYG